VFLEIEFYLIILNGFDLFKQNILVIWRKF
jgi:hypothetical protein